MNSVTKFPEKSNRIIVTKFGLDNLSDLSNEKILSPSSRCKEEDNENFLHRKSHINKPKVLAGVIKDYQRNGMMRVSSNSKYHNDRSFNYRGYHFESKYRNSRKKAKDSIFQNKSLEESKELSRTLDKNHSEILQRSLRNSKYYTNSPKNSIFKSGNMGNLSITEILKMSYRNTYKDKLTKINKDKKVEQQKIQQNIQKFIKIRAEKEHNKNIEEHIKNNKKIKEIFKFSKNIFEKNQCKNYRIKLIRRRNIEQKEHTKKKKLFTLLRNSRLNKIISNKDVFRKSYRRRRNNPMEKIASKK